MGDSKNYAEKSPLSKRYDYIDIDIDFPYTRAC